MKKDDNDKIQYYFDRKLEIVLKSIDDMNRYNSTVCSIGYISLLAIMSYLHKYIYPQLLIWICLLFALSVAIFVIFEIRKIFLNNVYRSKILANLEEFIENSDEDKEKLIKKNIATKTECYKNFYKEQNRYFIPSALCGFTAGALIFINFIQKFLINIIQNICLCH